MELLLIIIALVALSIFDRPAAARTRRSRRNVPTPTPEKTPAASDRGAERTDQQQPIALDGAYLMGGVASGT